MSRQVPLHELEKAKKVMSLTEKTLKVGKNLFVVGVGVSILAFIVSIIWGTWATYGMAWGIVTLVGIVATILFGGAGILNDMAKTKIRCAEHYGTIDE